MTVESGHCYGPQSINGQLQPIGTCYKFPVYAASLPGMGNYLVTDTPTSVCFEEESVYVGNLTSRQLFYDDPLTKGNEPPSGLWDVSPGYDGGTWEFDGLSPG